MFNYLPFSYTFKSRLITVPERISWLIIYPLFLLFCVFLLDSSYVFFIFNFIAVMSVYEVGYLYNDFITTKRESNPTIRYEDENDFFFLNFSKTVFARLVLSYGISLFVFLVNGSAFLLCVVTLILFFYFLHNTIRSKLNVLTYLSLVTLRYIGPIIFIDDISVLLLVFLCFPVCRTVEHACKVKYGFNGLRLFVGDFDKFRVFYYSLLFIVVLSLKLYLSFSFISILLVFYFLFYRGVALLVREKVARQTHSSYK